MFIHLFIMHIKDLFKFPLVYNITVIIPFSYFTCNISTFFYINVYLARDLFKELKVDF